MRGIEIQIDSCPHLFKVHIFLLTVASACLSEWSYPLKCPACQCGSLILVTGSERTEDSTLYGSLKQ